MRRKRTRGSWRSQSPVVLLHRVFVTRKRRSRRFVEDASTHLLRPREAWLKAGLGAIENTGFGAQPIEQFLMRAEVLRCRALAELFQVLVQLRDEIVQVIRRQI